MYSDVFKMDFEVGGCWVFDGAEDVGGVEETSVRPSSLLPMILVSAENLSRLHCLGIGSASDELCCKGELGGGVSVCAVVCETFVEVVGGDTLG